MRGRRCTLLALLVAAACGEDLREGEEALRSGRPREALEFFRRVAREEGDSPALLRHLAVAALLAGEPGEAERAAERLGEEGARFRRHADFLMGNVAFVRSLRAEEAAARPGAPPSLAERAVADAEDALAHWRRAAAGRDDWPEARRNAERALLRLDRLRRKKGDPGEPPPPPPEPQGGPPEPPPPEEKPPERPSVETSELSPEGVLGLLETLREREREKLAIRRARREARAADVERDW